MKQFGILGVLLWICVRHGQGDGCKTDVFAKCFGADFALFGDSMNVQNICEPQKLLSALICLDKLKTEREHEVGHKLDTSGWSKAMTFFCDNQYVMSENAECMSSAGVSLEQCAAETATAKNLTKERGRRYSSDLNCERTAETVNCFDRKLTKTCPNDVRDVLTKVYRLKTKASCIFGCYNDTPPTDSSLRDTVTKSRSSEEESPPDEEDEDEPLGNGAQQVKLFVLNPLLILYAVCKS